MDPVDPDSFYAPAPPRTPKPRAQPQPRPPPTPATSAPTVPSTPDQFTIPTTPASFSTVPFAISTPAAQSSSAHFPIPTTPISSNPAASTQPKLRRPKKNQWQKADSIVHLITKEFRSLGAFLEVLFHIRDVSASDPRTASHKQQVTAFLDGESNIGMAHIIDLIYRHPQGRPPSSDTESDLYFAPPDVAKPRDIKLARPALSTWALQLVGPELRRQIGNLTQNDPDDPEDITRLRASTNGRAKLIRSATWDDLGRVSIPWMAATYKRRTRAGWYVTECMGAPTVNGAIIIRSRRPHPTVQVGVIDSLTLSRNRYTSGYLALPLAIWQFACKAHVDEKRMMSRSGFTVHDSTARACLDSLTDSSLAKLRESVAEGIKTGTMRWQIVLDNVQQYCRQRDHRIGRQDVLKIGTAATAILLEDCAPGAFDLQDHLERVMRQERRELTTELLFEDIDWPYIQDLMALNWVRILVNFIPQLAHLRKEVSALFKSDAMTKLRLRLRTSLMQPLGTNAERETETQGMMRAILDFMKQMGLDETALYNLIFIARGDGASVAAMWRIQKFLAAHPSHYKAFRNLVPPGSEAWHTRWTQLNAMAANHYGPVSSSDPSFLSKSATAAGAKRPTNLKKVDFFPTSRSMQLFYEARVLDCFRVSFEADDIIAHFEDPRTPVPDVESLRESARVLFRRYASQEAYNQALSEELTDSASEEMKIPRGTPWTQPVDNSQSERADDAYGDAEPDDDTEAVVVDDLAENAGLEEFFEDAESDSRTKKGKKQKKGKHIEAPGFSGDRGMANGILFLQDMGWWVIAAHAVPDGEVGRLWEILKVWIINFSGSSNHNYTNYLLEMYCLHRYEASKDFSDAMFNNSLVNPTGLQWVECDFAQEGYNKWLEEMVEHKGGDFDDHFYRHTLAPNVMHFLRIKEQMQTAFELKPRGKTHTAPHLRNEFQQLLRMHKEDELHLFRPGRTNGHAEVNFFHRGYERLEESRMANFIEQSTAYADIMRDVLNPEYFGGVGG
ncbi:hypothetical protein B0H17DRAFT_1204590 [Mycena rosella]|uniref:DUF6589 domain-containing protein n=1 Tax=Mycena rosella TaxID=1033263 RepID=A0AAD7GAZ9_MYCRO|nr:hypothetical protein B0H17DRAFT_1204590 [Mycena rosella]